ncbi:sugar kinase [Cupriavidus sp. CV2]|uniref:sugar kinase n=1 Tax=Cupriavidus ulmosensis TaxID=3065913 RepID=UPI00296B1586|nr:sugar kinase [Cupriavidus sp. CV2]MDW3688415.1 sugar kinase [Cupriavidus sp. CV2]
MGATADRKVVLVTRKTRLEALLARYHSLAQARFYLEHLGADITDYQREHDTYLAAREQAVAVLSRYLRRQVVDRQFLPNFLFGPEDIVVALGQDGLVANTMKYLNGQPLIGVNPDPARHDGVLLPFQVGDLARVLAEAMQDRRPARPVTMARAELSDQQVLYAVNDFFIGPRSHTSARYEIQLGAKSEVQSSSGVIVSTGLGSTAWLKSIVTGARAIAQADGGAETPYQSLPWDTDRLVFAVREPFPSRASQATLVYGNVPRGEQIVLRSLMPETGVIFSDGIEADFLQFNAGTEARIGVAERSGQLVQ